LERVFNYHNYITALTPADTHEPHTHAFTHTTAVRGPRLRVCNTFARGVRSGARSADGVFYLKRLKEVVEKDRIGWGAS